MNLHEIQSKVHVAKDKRNDFGGYNYRTAEGILAALKAALPEGGHVVVSDTIQEVGGQIFVTATATIYLPDCPEYTAQGHAMHPLTKKGMDPSQITGAASSYARKYALAGLLALDDGSADPDAAKEVYQPDPKQEPRDPVKIRDGLLAAVNRVKVPADLTRLRQSEKYKAAISWLGENDQPKAFEVQAAVDDAEATMPTEAV